MVTVRVRLKILSPLIDMAGISDAPEVEHKMEVEVGESATIGDLIDKLTLLYGERFRKTILNSETGALQRYVMILVNGHLIDRSVGLKTSLNNGETLIFLMPRGGG